MTRGKDGLVIALIHGINNKASPFLFSPFKGSFPTPSPRPSWRVYPTQLLRTLPQEDINPKMIPLICAETTTPF